MNDTIIPKKKLQEMKQLIAEDKELRDCKHLIGLNWEQKKRRNEIRKIIYKQINQL